MGYIDSAVRANINEEIAAAFAASTQKYLLGTDGDPFEDVSRWNAYIGSIFNIDATEDGIVPQFGQLPQPSMQPLTDHFRNLCAKMSAATGIHVSQFGLVHDQPSSAEAIYAENEPLILKVFDWNDDASIALTDVAIACLATEQKTSFDEIAERDYNILPCFRDPVISTLAQTVDAHVKIASQVDGYALTPSFWKEIKHNNDDAVRAVLEELDEVKGKEAASAAVTAIFGGGND